MKKIYQIHVLFFVFAFFLGANTTLNAVNYSWNGAISTEWGNPSNWSPVGVPGSTDNVTINSAASNQPVWEENPGIQNLTMTNGTLNLAGFSMSITGTCIFTGGTVTNGTLLMTGNSVTFTGSTINANVQYTGNRFLFNGGTFNGTVNVTKSGGANDVCNGNCIFNNSVSITNQSTSYIYLANINPDRYNQTVTFRALGNGVIYPARTATGTQFNGNIIVASTGTGGVRFGQNGGTSTLASGKTITIGSDGFTNGELNIRGMIKNGTTPISITGTGSSRIRFEQNSTFNGKVTCVFPLIHMSGSTFNDTLRITKNGTGNISGNGGCTFNAPVYITKSNTGNFQFGDVNPDIFQADVYIDDNTGATGSIMLARTANGNVFAGDIYINMNASGINFGANGGRSTLASGKTIRLWNDGCTAGTLGLRYFTQTGSTPIVLTQTTGTATLAFQLNSVFNADVTVQFPNISFQGSTFNGIVTSTKISNSNNTSTGGNTFNARFNLNISGNGGFTMSSASPDICNGPLYLDNNSTSGSISMGATALDNQINGGLYVNNSSTGGIGFGSGGGTTTIAAASDIAFFNDGYSAGPLNFRGINRLGTSGITLNQTTGTSTVAFLLGTTINGPVNITYPNINLDRAVFNGAFSFTKSVSSNNTCAGGCTYNSTFTFTNAVGGSITMASTYADIFNDVTTVNQSAASVFYFAHTATGNQFNGNILLNSTGASQGIRFGQNNGSSTLATGKTISPGASGILLGSHILRNFVQSGATAQTFSQTTGTALLQLEAGCIFNGAVNIDVPQLIVNGTTFNSTAILKKNGAGNNVWTGSDLFTSATSIINTGSGYLQIGTTTSSAFNAATTLSSYSAGGVIYMSNTATGDVFNGDILLNSTNATGGIYFGQGGGTASLASGFRVMAGTDGITAGIIRLRNFTQVGATAQTLTGSGSTAAIYLESGSVFNAASTVTFPQVYLNGTNFANTLGVTQTGATAVNSAGGCTFSSATSLTNSGTAVWTLGNTAADIFQSTLTVACSGVNSQINLAHTGAGNQFNGNIILNSFNGAAGIRIGNNNGSSTLATSRTITVGASGFSAGSLRIRNLTQVGTTAQTFAVSGTSGSMYLETGNVFNGAVTFSAPQMYLNGTTFNGTTSIEQTSTYSVSSNGGNTFNAATTLLLSGTGPWYQANISPDIFNSTLLARNTSTNILYLAQSATGSQFNGVVTFEATTNSQGIRIGQGTAPTISLGTAGRFVSTAVGFVGGSLRIRNVTQTGTQAHTLTVGGTTTAIYFETGNTFTGATTAVAPQLYLNGTTFAAGTFTQNGATTTYSNGGNTYNGATVLNLTGTGSWTLSNASVDTYNSTLALNSSGAASVLYLAHNGVGTTFNGTITMTSTGTSAGIRFGQGTNGSSTLTGTASLAIGAAGFTSGSLRFRRFVQTGTAALTLSNTTAAVQAYMETGTVFNGVVNFNFAQHFLNGATFNGTTTLQNNGSATVSCTGGNVFNGTTTLNCTGSGEWRQATSANDDYNGTVSFRQTTAAKLYPAYAFNALFSGNVTTVGSTALITFTPAANAGRVVFDGSGTQTFQADAGKLPVIPSLEIAKTGGSITPNFILIVSKALFMTSGIITTSATNYLVLNDNVTSTVASASSYVNGPVRKIGNDAFTFPVGRAGYYRPISIGAPSTVTDHFTAEYFMSNSNASYSHNSKDASINHISTNEYWILNRTGGTSNVIVTLSWDGFVSGGVNSSSNLRVVRWNGTMWKDHGNGGIVGQTIGTSGAVTSFSPFTLASNNNQNPLPVELLSFKAEAQEKHVQLDWSTASEINNHFFTIERSLDLITYEKVAEVKGAGNSNTLRSYAAIDAAPISGISYYRLVQTDYDGTRREYDPQMVQFNNESTVSDLNVYPNPFDQQFTVKLPAAKEGNYTMNISDATGSIIGSAALKASDLIGYEVNLQHYMPGIYTVQIIGEDLNLVKRVVKKN